MGEWAVQSAKRSRRKDRRKSRIMARVGGNDSMRHSTPIKVRDTHLESIIAMREFVYHND
jgi:CelD/BcsL family acetyltransferase involved in cellulose biosynthesis